MKIYCEICQVRNEGNNHAKYFQNGIHVCEKHYMKSLHKDNKEYKK